MSPSKATFGRIFTALFGAACWLTALAPVFGQLPATELKTILPAGGKTGSTFEVVITGSDLTGVDQILFSHNGISAKPMMNEPDEFHPAAWRAENKFTVTIADNVPAGIYEARVIGRYGASNPRPFAVNRLDEISDKESTTDLEQAPAITIPAVVNGNVDGGNRDHFKVSLKKGQRFIADCYAERLDSRMDGALVVYSMSGAELARNRGAVGLDPVVDFTAPADGDYVIGIYDFVYGGGAEYFYRLKIHSGPQIDFIFPPSAAPGSSSKFTLFGRNLPQGKPAAQFPGAGLEEQTVTIQAPKESPAAVISGATFLTPLHAATQSSFLYQISNGPAQSNAASIYLSKQPIVAEVEPNNSSESAHKVSVPCEVVGQFYPARDLDWFEFEAAAGETWWIEAVSHRLRKDSDPYLIVQKVTSGENGETVSKVAGVDDPTDRNGKIGTDYDTTTDDPIYRLEVKETARYRVAVRDQFGDGQSDPSSVYRLIIRQPDPSFQLVAEAPARRVANANIVAHSSLSIRKGGAVAVPVHIKRQDGFDGVVEISATGLPSGVTCQPCLVGGVDSVANLVFSADANAKAAAAPITIVGKATIDNQAIVRQAAPATVQWTTTNRNNSSPSFRCAEKFLLAVVDKESYPVSVTLGDGKMLETARGGQLDIPIKVERRAGGEEAIKLSAIGLPAELKLADVTIAKGAKDGKIEFKVTNNNAKPGVYNFVVRGDFKFKYSQNPEAVAETEAEQKRFDQLVKDISAKQKTADDAKNKSAAEFTKKQNELKQAEQEKTAAEAEAKQAKQAFDKAADEAKAESQKKLTEAEAKLKAAIAKVEEAKKQLTAAETMKTTTETAAKEAADQLKRAQAEKKKVDDRLAAVKKSSAPKDVTYWQYSTPVSVNIKASPYEIKQPAAQTIKQEAKTEVTIDLEKNFGFDDKVDVSISIPKSAAGVTAKATNIPKGQTQVKVEVTANDKAVPGKYEFTVIAKSRFNNVTVESQSVIPFTVQPK